MALAFRLTSKAQEDLKVIARYTQETWGKPQRNKYLQLLDDGFHLLAGNPDIGHDCSGIRHGYRKYIVGRHVVFYRKMDGVIEIVRVLHQSMDVDHAF